VTQRKCGTCRFYGAGTQQTYGQCRNPAYPRRDDAALLRPEEMGCRSGWGKDFWTARDGEMAAAAPILPGLQIDPSLSLSLAPTSVLTSLLPPLAAAMPVPDQTPMQGEAPVPAPVAARRSAPQAANTASPVAIRQETNRTKESRPASDPAMLNHPEIGENGVLLRPVNKRSAVADAHRKALARREEERLQSPGRDRPPVVERAALVVEREPLLVEARAPLDAPPTVFAPMPSHQRPAITAQDLTRSHFDLPTPSAPTFTLPRAPREESRPAPIALGATPEPAAIARPEPAAVDVHISTVESAMQESPREAVIPTRPQPSAPPVAPAATAQQGVAARAPIASPGHTPSVSPGTIAPASATTDAAPFAATAGTAANTVTSEPRYWDHPANDRFEKMREMREESQTARLDQHGVKSIGRTRAESPSLAPEAQPGRTIRHLPSNGASAPPVTDAAPVRSDQIRARAEAGMPRPAPQPPVAASVAPPRDIPPRQIDEALLRQLEDDWRATALEAHAGRRCSGCRFFQSSDGVRGSCGCTLAPVHRRPVESQDLGCLSTLGTWWSATDDGWLERAERRPRRATPLLDSLLREREAEEVASAGGEQRRSAR